MKSEDHAADRRIAEKIKRRDFDDEVEAWIRLFAKKAMLTARRWGHTWEDAEDFVQDFHVWLLRNNLKTYQPEQPLFSYCFRVFLNQFSKAGAARARAIRDAAPIDPVPDAPPGAAGVAVVTSADPSIEQSMMSQQTMARLEEALDALRPVDRQLIVDRILDEQPYLEIAQRLGISKGTVRVRVHRALDRLRQSVQSVVPPADERVTP